MTTIEAITFAAQVVINSEIQMGDGSILIVERVTAKSWSGTLINSNRRVLDSNTHLSFSTLTNPHYNKNIKLLK